MEYYYTIIFTLLLFCFSCSNPVINKLEKDIKINNTNYINLQKFTSFSWDKLIIIGIHVKSSKIHEVLGYKYKNEEEMTVQMIFLKSNNIVHIEKQNIDPEFNRNKINFDFPNEDDCIVFNNSNALFKTETEIIDKNLYYILKPIQ